MILPQNVIPLVREDVARNSTATSALDAVQAALTTEDLMAMDKKVDSERQDPDQVAGEWLTSRASPSPRSVGQESASADAPGCRVRRAPPTREVHRADRRLRRCRRAGHRDQRSAPASR